MHCGSLYLHARGIDAYFSDQVLVQWKALAVSYKIHQDLSSSTSPLDRFLHTIMQIS